MVEVDVSINVMLHTLDVSMNWDVDVDKWWYFDAKDVMTILTTVYGARMFDPWRRLREWHTMRSIVFYWDELTQHQMAPGGNAYHRDKALFEVWRDRVFEEESG